MQPESCLRSRNALLAPTAASCAVCRPTKGSFGGWGGEVKNFPSPRLHQACPMDGEACPASSTACHAATRRHCLRRCDDDGFRPKLLKGRSVKVSERRANTTFLDVKTKRLYDPNAASKTYAKQRPNTRRVPTIGLLPRQPVMTDRRK